jgi:hypothetical protein
MKQQFRLKLVLAFVMFVSIAVDANALPGGIVGRTRRSTTAGCGASGCHGSKNNGLSLTLVGDAVIQPGQTKQYSITVPSNLGTTYGGINIAVSGGTLAPVSSNLRLDTGELAHNARQTMPVIFTFNYTAPNSPGTMQTMYAVGKGGGSASNGNNWNDAPDKRIDVIALPAAPVAQAATGITQTRFTANWSSVSGVTGYRLDVAPNSAFSTFVPGYQNRFVSGTSELVSPVSAGTTYYYRVRAENQVGLGPYSNIVSALTVPPNPVATTSTNIIAESFTANWNVSQSATSYRLDVARNQTFTDFVDGYNNRIVNATSASVTGLTRVTPYYSRVRAVNASGTSDNSNVVLTTTAATSVEISRSGIPDDFTLNQNHPNPFNPSTTIIYGIPKRAHVVLTVYNLAGEEVARLVDGIRDAGAYDVLWDAKDERGNFLASGVYLYRLVASADERQLNFVQSMKAILVR